MPVTRITTNIDSRLLSSIDEQAKARQCTRRKMLEFALQRFDLEAYKKRTIDAYNEMADDKEEMATWLRIANNPANLSVGLKDFPYTWQKKKPRR